MSEIPTKENESFKSASLELYERYLRDGTTYPGDYPFYKILSDLGLINLSDKEIGFYYRMAQDYFLTIESRKPFRERRKLLYIKSRNLTVVFKAKSFILNDFFNSIKEQNKTLIDVL